MGLWNKSVSDARYDGVVETSSARADAGAAGYAYGTGGTGAIADDRVLSDTTSTRFPASFVADGRPITLLGNWQNVVIHPPSLSHQPLYTFRYELSIALLCVCLVSSRLLSPLSSDNCAVLLQRFSY